MTIDLTGPTQKPMRLRRVLAIDPTHRGFGFAVLETPDRLVDWGVVHVRSDTHAGCMKRIGQLIEHHQPTVIVTEDGEAEGSRRGTRVRKLIAAVQRLTLDLGARSAAVSLTKTRHAFSRSDPVTKYDIVVAIAERFPELRPVLPRRRKCYMSEDERTTIFQAVAYATSPL